MNAPSCYAPWWGAGILPAGTGYAMQDPWGDKPPRQSIGDGYDDGIPRDLRPLGLFLVLSPWALILVYLLW